MTMPDELRESWLQSRLLAYDEALGLGYQPPAEELPFDGESELATRLRHRTRLLGVAGSRSPAVDARRH